MTDFADIKLRLYRCGEGILPGAAVGFLSGLPSAIYFGWPHSSLYFIGGFCGCLSSAVVGEIHDAMKSNDNGFEAA